MHDPERLLEHTWFLRRVARALTTDEAAAEDLVQDTYLAALEHPPRRAATVKAWLARVLRNRAVSRHRSDTRRQRREARVAPTEPVPCAAEIAEKEALARRVVDAVFRLDEPYLSTILLRYYEDLAPAAIADSQGVPLETVRTHLRRGLVRLREELDRAEGGRHDWRGALALWFVAGADTRVAAGAATLAGETSSASGSGVTLQVGSMLLIGVVAALLLVGTMFMWPGDSGPSELASRSDAGTEDDTPPPSPVDNTLAAGSTREARDAGDSAADDDRGDGEDRATVGVSGRVVDAISGELIVGAVIRLGPNPSTTGEEYDVATTTDESGEYRFEEPWVSGVVQVYAPGYCQYRVGFHRNPEHVIELEPGLVITGRVLAADGTPVNYGILRLYESIELRPGRDGLHYSAQHTRLSYPLAADGRFEVAVASTRVAFGASAPGHGPGFSSVIEPVPGRDNHVVIRMTRGVVFEGTVQDPAGEPVAGAEVWVRYEEPEVTPIRSTGAARVLARSDSDGRFRVLGPAEPVRSVSVHHDQYQHGQEQDLPVDAGPVVFVLQPGQWLTGRLVNDRGEPLSRQSARQEAGGEHWNFRIGDDGRFRTHSFPLDSSNITLFVDGHDPIEHEWSHLGAGAHDVGELVVSQGEYSLQVAVTCEGKPVAGAGVRVSLPNHSRNSFTDSRGVARVGGLTAAAARVQILRTGYRHWMAQVDLANESPLQVSLVRTARVRGRVVDEAGRPWFAVGVCADSDGCRGMSCAPDGRFVVRALPPGEPVKLRLRVRPGHERMEITLAPLAPGELRDLGDVVVSRGGDLEGRVIDVNGEPIAGVGLRLGTEDATVNALTGADGVFRFREFPLGAAHVSIEQSGFMPIRYRSVVVPGPEPLEITLVRTRRYEGRVVSGDAAVAGASISVSSRDRRFLLDQHGRTDDDGRFALDVPPEGRVDVRVRHEAFEPWSHSCEVDQLPEVISLEAGATLELRVTDPQGLAKSLTLRFTGKNNPVSRSVQVVDGRALAGGLAEGTYQLRVESGNCHPVEVGEVQLVEGQTTTRSIELLPRGAEVTVRVLGSDGEPVRHAVLRLGTLTAGGSLRERDSLHFFPHRPTKAWLDADTAVLVSAPDHRPLLLEGAANQVVEGNLTIQLEAGAVLLIRVLDASGESPEKLHGRAVWLDPILDRGHFQYGMEYEDGVLRVDSLGPGRYTIELSGHRTRYGTLTAEVGAGETREIEHRLPRGFDVTGRVRKNGVVMAAGRVDIRQGRAFWTSGDVDESGYYRVNVPRVGDYELTYWEGGPEILPTPGLPCTIAGDAEVDIDYWTRRLAGRVVGPDGAPMADLSGHVYGNGRRNFVTDASGQFVLDEVIEGDFQLRIDSPPEDAYAPPLHFRVEGDTEVEYRFVPTTRLELVIDSGAAALPDKIACYPLDPEGGDSRYRVQQVAGTRHYWWPEGSQLGMVTARGFARAVFHVDDPEAGAHVRLYRAGSLQIVLPVGPHGRTLDDHPLRVEPLDGIDLEQRFRDQRTMGGGLCNLTLRPGRYRISTTDAAGAPITREVTVLLSDQYRRVVLSAD